MTLPTNHSKTFSLVVIDVGHPKNALIGESVNETVSEVGLGGKVFGVAENCLLFSVCLVKFPLDLVELLDNDAYLFKNHC
jgi:hypothetical protein